MIHPQSGTSTCRYSNQAGFSLIEVMVVMVLLSLMMLGATSLFILNMKSSIRTSIRQDLKEEGLFLMNQIEFIIKNSVEILDTNNQCANPSSNQDLNTSYLILRTINGETVRIGNDSNLITMNNISTGVNDSLSSTAVEVGGTNFLTCFVNGSGEKFVQIDFTLTRARSDNANDISATSQQVVENFHRLVQLRN